MRLDVGDRRRDARRLEALELRDIGHGAERDEIEHAIEGALPAPQPGSPPRERYAPATPGPGWVATTAPENTGPELEAHYLGGRGMFNIVRSLTLVPTAATQLFGILDQLYMENPGMGEGEDIGRSISRAQMEFLAARSSSLLGCFY